MCNASMARFTDGASHSRPTASFPTERWRIARGTAHRWRVCGVVGSGASGGCLNLYFPPDSSLSSTKQGVGLDQDALRSSSRIKSGDFRLQRGREVAEQRLDRRGASLSDLRGIRRQTARTSPVRRSLSRRGRKEPARIHQSIPPGPTQPGKCRSSPSRSAGRSAMAPGARPRRHGGRPRPPRGQSRARSSSRRGPPPRGRGARAATTQHGQLACILSHGRRKGVSTPREGL